MMKVKMSASGMYVWVKQRTSGGSGVFVLFCQKKEKKNGWEYAIQQQFFFYAWNVDGTEVKAEYLSVLRRACPAPSQALLLPLSSHLHVLPGHNPTMPCCLCIIEIWSTAFTKKKEG